MQSTVHAIAELVSRHSATVGRLPARFCCLGLDSSTGSGIDEFVRDYPASSWFGVTLYVSLLGAVAGFVLGIIAGAISRLL
jgi:ABC-type dipeptide/oligopeptide/nickel transport system permease subunit